MDYRRVLLSADEVRRGKRRETEPLLATESKLSLCQIACASTRLQETMAEGLRVALYVLCSYCVLGYIADPLLSPHKSPASHPQHLGALYSCLATAE